MALWLACTEGAEHVPWSLALTSTTLLGLPAQEQAAGGPAKGKGGALTVPKHLCQGWKPPTCYCHLLSNSGDGQNGEDVGGLLRSHRKKTNSVSRS